MRVAVKGRPIEKFDTDLQLPEWQLEPDEEWMLDDPGDEYYYVDEQGNLIEPGFEDEPGDLPVPVDGERSDPRTPAPVPGRNAPQAASDDFLDRATGAGSSDAPARRAPAVTPPPPPVN